MFDDVIKLDFRVDPHLKDVIADIVDLNGRRAIAFIYFRAQQTLESGWSGHEDDFVSIKYLALDSVANKEGRLIQ